MISLMSREDLANYALRQLGHPVIQINVDDQQVDDRVDDAIRMFQEFHSDGSQTHFIAHRLTQVEIDKKMIEIPDTVCSVVRVFPNANSSSDVNLQYQAFMTDLISTAFQGNAGNYMVSQSYLSSLQQIFNSEKGTRFNRYSKMLYIDTDWSKYSVGDFIVIECYMIMDPDDWTSIYDDIWLKAYTTALIKRQWGSNLSKYAGFVLPSGMSIDGATIYQQAIAEVEKLELDLQDKWSLPLDFFTG